jgi:hypothetical protein
VIAELKEAFWRQLEDGVRRPDLLQWAVRRENPTATLWEFNCAADEVWAELSEARRLMFHDSDEGGAA